MSSVLAAAEAVAGYSQAQDDKHAHAVVRGGSTLVASGSAVATTKVLGYLGIGSLGYIGKTDSEDFMR